MKNKIINTVFALFVVLTFVLLFADLAISAEVTLDEIIRKAEAQQEKIKNNIDDVIFVADMMYKEFKKDGKIKKTVKSQRQVFIKKTDKRRDDYLYVIVDGKKLDENEMRSEVDKWKKRSKSMDQTKMPLNPEAKEDYEYSLIGSDNLNSLPVWIVGFKAKKEEEGYINGRAYISGDHYNIIRAEFKPARVHRVIDDMNLSLTYSEVNGYWMPAKFKMDMKVRIGLLVTEIYRRIEIEELYSQYKFNNRLADSFFDSE